MYKKFLLTLLLLLSTLAARADWAGDKYSLFIHYGLYSTYGGVYDGVPVRDGYSEQIFSFGVHYMDVYEEAMQLFTAADFSADSIVALAQRAGMRSIVLTAKHHEGFCLWDTATTDYSSASAPLCGRDLVGELAEACHLAGVGFGLYFSLIDWHYPQAMPYTSHNADRITPEHHEYNKRQVTELLTRYGAVDELWFDMGSLTADQSRELYELVKSLQPDCMVSGRLGNDCADFAVFPDNATPDYAMDIPWQTAASFFPETWGYRSWQRRDSVTVKAREKLADLLRIVSGGGKYLLNIGPMGDGAVVPFEQKVLELMGCWISPMAEAIYGTKGFYSSDCYITRSEDARTLYLFVPDDRTVVPLPELTAVPSSVESLDGADGVELLESAGQLLVHCAALDGRPFRAIRLSFDQSVALVPEAVTPIYAYSLADYYAGFRSIVGYRYAGSPMTEVTYIDAYEGREVELGGAIVTLQGQAEQRRSPRIQLDGPLLERSAQGLLGTMPADDGVALTPREGRLLGDTLAGPAQHHRGIIFRQEVVAEKDGDLRLDLTYGGTFLLYLDDTYIDGGFTRAESETISLLLPMTLGQHRITIKLYNAFGPAPWALLAPHEHYTLRRMTLPETTSDLTIKRPHRFPYASPAHLSAIRPR